MPKVTLNEAQRINDAAVRALSDRLLGHENVAQAEIASQFRAWIPQPVLVKKVSTIRNNAELRAMWVDNHTAAMLATIPVVQRMATKCANTVLSSTRRELQLAERALGAKAAGRAAAADVDPAATIKTLIGVYQGSHAIYRANYRTAQTNVLSTAQTVDDALARLFGSRGVWWPAMRSLQDAARRMSIGLTNQLRLDAIGAFNG